MLATSFCVCYWDTYTSVHLYTVGSSSKASASRTILHHMTPSGEDLRKRNLLNVFLPLADKCARKVQ